MTGDAPRVALGVLVGVLVLLAAVRLARRHRGREAAELLLVAAVFAVVPPLVAFGVYFGAWHALRHTGRLIGLPGPDGPLSTGAALTRFVRGAALPTAVALGALVVLGRVADSGVVAVAIGVLLALTFPHLQAVAALDRRLADRERAGAV